MCATLAFDSPVGRLFVTEEGGAITGLGWRGTPTGTPSPELLEAKLQLGAFFAGERRDFQLALHVEGSDALRAVCAAMLAIPFGETRTYGEIARDVGLSAQAVGQLCGANPLPILIPCHRVLGAGGKLTGYSGGGGIETKVWLLRHEGAAGLLI